MHLLLEELTLEHKVFIVQQYYTLDEDLKRVREEFHKQFPTVQTALSILDTFQEIVDEFEETGAVAGPFYYEVIRELYSSSKKPDEGGEAQ